MNVEEHTSMSTAPVNQGTGGSPGVMFKIYKNSDQYYTFHFNVGGTICLHAGDQRFNEEKQVLSVVKLVQFYSQNPFNYEVSVAGRGSYRFEVKDPVTNEVIAISGGYDTEVIANDMIAKIRECVADADIVFF